MCDSVEVLWSQSTSGGGDGECVTVWRCCGILRLYITFSDRMLSLVLSSEEH